MLVVDDDKEIAYAISKLLEKENFNTLMAYNGKEALLTVESKRVDLIIMDIMMPDMDGLSATMRLREERNIPVIMLSAKSEDSDKILGLSIGADDYVTKPFNPAELMARVRSHLRRYKVLGGGDDFLSQKKDDYIKIGGLVLDKAAKNVIVDGESMRLDGEQKPCFFGGGHLRKSVERAEF